jgi:hypothetical protein
MISEEDNKRIEEARKCDNCLDWHKYCDAECCKQVTLPIRPKILERKGAHIGIPNKLNMNDRWYYALHGAKMIHERLLFEKKYCKVVDGVVIYFKKCDLLDENNLCKGHPNNKPKVCQKLNEYMSKLKNKSVVITPNCLFKYKKIGEQLNEKD